MAFYMYSTFWLTDTKINSMYTYHSHTNTAAEDCNWISFHLYSGKSQEKIFQYNYILKYQRIFSLPLATESLTSSIWQEAF